MDYFICYEFINNRNRFHPSYPLHIRYFLAIRVFLSKLYVHDAFLTLCISLYLFTVWRYKGHVFLVAEVNPELYNSDSTHRTLSCQHSTWRSAVLSDACEFRYPEVTLLKAREAAGVVPETSVWNNLTPSAAQPAVISLQTVHPLRPWSPLTPVFRVSWFSSLLTNSI
jgi:hypothetical protein